MTTHKCQVCEGNKPCKVLDLSAPSNKKLTYTMVVCHECESDVLKWHSRESDIYNHSDAELACLRDWELL